MTMEEGAHSAVDWSKPIEIVDGDRLIPATILPTDVETGFAFRVEAGGSKWWTNEDGTIPATDLIVRNVVEKPVTDYVAAMQSIVTDEEIDKVATDAMLYGVGVAQDGKRVDPATFRVTIDYFSLIRGWAQDRNLIAGSTPDKQMLKLVEEFGELGAGMARGRLDLTKDAIGDMIVVLTILSAQHGVEIEDCIAAAWNEIKDRKGRMIDGVFVKEGDQAA